MQLTLREDGFLSLGNGKSLWLSIIQADDDAATHHTQQFHKENKIYSLLQLIRFKSMFIFSFILTVLTFV